MDRAVLRVALVMALGAIMSLLDTAVVNVAFEELGRDLDSSISSLQWVVTSYLLALAVVIPPSGWAVRRFGERRLYLASLAVFTGASVLCGLAWSTESLVAFRILQGIGGGMLAPISQMYLSRVAGPEHVGRALGLMGIPLVVAPMIGPGLGGVLIDQLSWRWIFFINIPIGLVTLLLGMRLLPRLPRLEAGRLDVIGFVLLGAGLPSLTYGLATIGSAGGLTTTALATLVLGFGLIAVFVVHALRAPNPLLDVRLFGNRAFAAAGLANFAVGTVLWGALIMLPLYYETVRGQSALAAGLLVAPQALGSGLAMILSGRLTDRIGGGSLTVAGVLTMALATIPFAFVGTSTSYALLCGVVFVRGIGIGLATGPTFAAAYRVIRPDQLGDATPQLNVIMRVGASLGTAIFAVLLGRELSHSAGTPAADASAYATTYWWIIATTTLALIPAVMLRRAERRIGRRATPPVEMIVT
jgi:EmrB/QacA subfamily drug resistance transporter